MFDLQIQAAIDKYLEARHELLLLGKAHPHRIGGNDNIIGRIGEFIALRFLESLGQKPMKMEGSSNQGYDFIDGSVQTQVKVITEENKKGAECSARRTVDAARCCGTRRRLQAEPHRPAR